MFMLHLTLSEELIIEGTDHFTGRRPITSKVTPNKASEISMKTDGSLCHAENTPERTYAFKAWNMGRPPMKHDPSEAGKELLKAIGTKIFERTVP
ncbi:hypothetical protein HHI36_001261 [Cryptolaemus montrouzieri]|uniref:Uncharacterized protein n=1 Tax=Cryptolaemus montrouzieri TaxID=559131 RepID=A0ABD2P715_9CUCU